MSTNLQRSQILEKIRNDKEYRDNFVAEQIYSRLPLKIRNMRLARHLKQRELAAQADVAPEWITQVENPNYGRFTLKTLLKIAAALDVGLLVDFVPYSKVVNDTLSLRNSSFDAPSAKDDIGLVERKGPHSEASLEGVNGLTGTFANDAFTVTAAAAAPTNPKSLSYESQVVGIEEYHGNRRNSQTATT